MKPIPFEGQNTVIAKDQKEYVPLPALRFNDEQGNLVFCSYLSPRERLKVLFTGRIWVCLLTFNKPVTPSFLTVNRDEVFKLNKPESKFKMACYNLAKKFRLAKFFPSSNPKQNV